MRAMAEDALHVLRAAIESGTLRSLKDLYAADAVFEGYLPGGVRDASGPRAIVNELARDIDRPARIVSWETTGSHLTLFTLELGDPPRRMRRGWKLAVRDDGTISRHWAYADSLDADTAGMSGARIRRVERPGGAAVYEKWISRDHDWLMRITEDDGREATLWTTGALANVPAGPVYPVVDVVPGPEGDGWLITTRDMSEHLFDDEPTIDQWRVVFDAIEALHDHFRGVPTEGLCTLENRFEIFSEATCRRELGGSDWLPKSNLHGWRVLPTILPDDIREPFLDLVRSPAPLLAALRETESTLIHGDLRPANLGIESGRVIALDWALAAAAPPIVDLAWVAMDVESRDEIQQLMRDVARPAVDERQLRLGLLYQACLALPGIGYWVTTAAPDLLDAAVVERDWWFDRAREGLAALAGARIGARR